MAVFADLSPAANLSGFAAAINAQFAAVRSLERGSVTPAVLIAGALWEKTDYAWAGGAGSAIMRYTGSSHVLLLDPRAAQINASGTVAMAANLAMGGFKITGAANGTDSTDLATVGQVNTLAAGTWTGNRNAGGFLLTNLGAPSSQTSDQVAARYDDTWQTTHGLCRYFDAITLDVGGGETNQCAGGKRSNPSVATTFCPRQVTFTLSGAITLVSGGLPLHTIARTVAVATRVNGDSGWIEVTRLGASDQVALEVQWSTSEPRGFSVRLRRVSSSALCTIAAISGLAISGVGFA